MRLIVGMIAACIAGCSGGSNSPSVSGAASKWPAQWCEAQPGIAKDKLVSLMGKPTSSSAEFMSWSDDHYQFNAFLEQDGTVRQLDTNTASYTEAEKASIPCKKIRSREAMEAAQAAAKVKNVLPACELVPAARMSEILGSAVAAEADGRKCIYKSSKGPFPYAEFEYGPGEGAVGMAGVGFAEKSQSGLTSPLEGLGDQAVAAGPAFFIRTGDDLATIVLSGVKDQKTAAKKILEAAKEKM